MSMSIDLDQKDSYPEVVKNTADTRKYFPTFRYSGKELDLPDEGEMTIRFKVVERTESERDGKKTCSYTIEVQSIEDVEEESDDSPTKSYDEAGSALDKIVEALSKKG
jgi:hypothetical protein